MSLPTNASIAVVSALFSACACLLLGRVGKRLGLVDRPGPRKRHHQPVVAAGGIAIFLTLLAVGLLLRVEALRSLLLPANTPGLGWGLIAGALLVHALGVLDDRHDLSPLTKLLGELAAAVVAILLSGLSLLSGVVGEPLGWLLMVLWFLALTNAMNFLDASDGVAATVGAICAGLLLLSALRTGEAAIAAMAACLAGALIGFLPFNRPPARMFLGDGGSLLIGFVLAYLAAGLQWFDFGWSVESSWWALASPLLVFAIPLYDLVVVVGLRAMQHVAPWRGDMRHFPHRLARRGFGPWQILVIVGACTVATGLGGVVLGQLDGWPAALVLVQGVTLLLLLATVEGLTGTIRAAASPVEPATDDLPAAELGAGDGASYRTGPTPPR